MTNYMLNLTGSKKKGYILEVGETISSSMVHTQFLAVTEEELIELQQVLNKKFK